MKLLSFVGTLGIAEGCVLSRLKFSPFASLNLEMKFWQTTMRAIDPRDGVLKTWAGMLIPGIDIDDAKNYCEKTGLHYLTVENKFTMNEKPHGRLENEIMNELYIFKLN